MNQSILILLLGAGIGAFSGLVGIGGGILLIPALMLGLGFSLHMAQGTTLAAMVPPIGLLAAAVYFKNGYVDLRAAGLIAAGFFLGGYVGAHLSVAMPVRWVETAFGLVLIAAGLKMVFHIGP